MGNKIQIVKTHLRENKKVYVASGITAVVVAGITALIMRDNTALGGVRERFNAHGGLTNTASFNFRNSQVINVTTVLDREGRGHPGWPVRNLETKRIFFSQREAAMALDIPEGRLSGHLKGLYPDVDGLHFERVNLVEAK
jgi:hypothetical protein